MLRLSIAVISLREFRRYLSFFSESNRDGSKDSEGTISERIIPARLYAILGSKIRSSRLIPALEIMAASSTGGSNPIEASRA